MSGNKITINDINKSTLQVHGAGEYVSKTLAVGVIEQLQQENKSWQAKNDALVARVARLQAESLNLAIIVENQDELPLSKWAIKSAYAVGKVKKKICSETESESLAEIKAAAVLEFSKDLVDKYPTWKKLLLVADNYANQLRQQQKTEKHNIPTDVTLLVEDAVMHVVKDLQSKHNVSLSSEALEEIEDKIVQQITSLVSEAVESSLNKQIKARVRAVIANTDFSSTRKDLADNIEDFFIWNAKVPTIQEVKILEQFISHKG